MIYIIIFIILYMTSLVEINYSIDCKNKIFTFYLLILVILIGGRYGNGADYERYEAIFKNISTDNFWRHDDPGFSAIALAFKTIGISSNFVFLFFAAVQIGLIGYYIVTNSRYKFPALLVYYSLYMFPLGFNAIAQGISVGIMLCSIRPIEEKKIIKVVIMGILAILFHRIGLLTMLICLIYNMKFSRNKLLCIIVGLFITSFIMNYCFTSNILVAFLPSNFQKIVLSYNSQYSDSVDLFGVAARIIMLLFVSLTFKQYDLIEQRTYLVYWIGFCVYVILASNDLLATKINLSLKILEMVLVCGTLSKIKDRETKSLMLTGLSLFLLTVVVSIMRHPDLYPYHSWIFGK